jgi:hypothetical protein
MRASDRPSAGDLCLLDWCCGPQETSPTTLLDAISCHEATSACVVPPPTYGDRCPPQAHQCTVGELVQDSQLGPSPYKFDAPPRLSCLRRDRLTERLSWLSLMACSASSSLSEPLTESAHGRSAPSDRGPLVICLERPGGHMYRLSVAIWCTAGPNNRWCANVLSCR